MRNRSKYYWSQWKEPKRFFIGNFGFTVWKWCGIWFPCWNVWLGDKYRIGYDIFHNGVGFWIDLPYTHIKLCTEGEIGWWYEDGRKEIHFFNYHYLKLKSKDL